MRALFQLLFGLVVFAAIVNGFQVVVPPSSELCFFEDLTANQKMGVTFEVSHGGHLDIDFKLHNPKHELISSASKENHGSYMISATDKGRYTFCFGNKMSKSSSKVVTFAVQTEHHDPREASQLERDVQELKQHLQSVSQGQNYLTQRERAHHSTVDSTNSRVFWWSILECVLLFLVVGWQIFYLRRFFEVKRSI